MAKAIGRATAAEGTPFPVYRTRQRHHVGGQADCQGVSLAYISGQVRLLEQHFSLSRPSAPELLRCQQPLHRPMGLENTRKCRLTSDTGRSAAACSQSRYPFASPLAHPAAPHTLPPLQHRTTVLVHRLCCAELSHKVVPPAGPAQRCAGLVRICSLLGSCLAIRLAAAELSQLLSVQPALVQHARWVVVPAFGSWAVQATQHASSLPCKDSMGRTQRGKCC